MINETRTTTELLSGLASESRPECWEEFDRRYRPILINIARRMGIDGEDAKDVAQDTLMRFAIAYRAGKYNRNQGRLRSWLMGIARYRILEARHARAKEAQNRGSSVIEQLDVEQSIETIWEVEQRQHMLRLAFEELREGTRMNERTVRAFEMLVKQQMSAASVAETLTISVHDVYVAKNRCLQKIRGILTTLEHSFEKDV